MPHGTDWSRRLERRVKRTVFGLLAGGTPPHATGPGAVDLRRVRRVLVIRANFRLGNLLLVTPALAALRGALPRARIDVLCADTYAPLLAHSPDVNRVVPIGRRLARNPAALVRLWTTLRRGRYDLVVDCARGASFLGAFFAALARGRWRVAAAGSRYQRCFNVLVPRGAPVTHKIDLLLDLLRSLGIRPVRSDVAMSPTPDEVARACVLWRTLAVPSERAAVGVFVGGRGTKRWDVDRLARVVTGLQADPRCAVVLLAGPEDGEQLRRLRRALSQPIATAPPLPVREFAALLRHCALVVSGDSGPMHLAAAVGVPTVAVFQGEAAASYAPRGPLHRALRDGADVVPAVLAAAREVVDELERRALPPKRLAYGAERPGAR